MRMSVVLFGAERSRRVLGHILSCSATVASLISIENRGFRIAPLNTLPQKPEHLLKL